MVDGQKEAGSGEKSNTVLDTGIEDEVAFRSMKMDDSGKLLTGRNVAAAVPGRARTFIVIGWVVAALTAFVSPWFAAPGVVSGLLADIKQRGSGNAIIITNIVFAVINLLFRYFFRNLIIT